MNVAQLEAEIELARLKLGHLESLLLLERGELPAIQTHPMMPARGALPAPKTAMAVRKCSHCGAKKSSRAFKGGGDTCTKCQRSDRRLVAEDVSKDQTGAYWRRCVRCEKKFGVRKFWGNGSVCTNCDPDGDTRNE